MPAAASGELHGSRLPPGAGIGLRSAHLEAFDTGQPDVAFLEVHTENYFHDGGRDPQVLDRLRERYAISLHGVGLALGSADPLDREHLRRVACAVRRFDPAAVSEHACWGHVDGRHYNDLLPLPFTEEAVRHLAARVSEVQDALGRRILLENVSQYVRFRHSVLTEGEFLAAVVAESGCALLLDVNNLYVNSVNVGFDARDTLAEVPAEAVHEIHLAGHLRKEIAGHPLLIDDHGSRVPEPVWELYAAALARLGAVPTLIEWDTNVPELDVLLAEAARAESILEARRARAA
jgi:uncharacterized protein (UPF0276 family)